MERLDLGAEAEHEVGGARDAGHATHSGLGEGAVGCRTHARSRDRSDERRAEEAVSDRAAVLVVPVAPAPDGNGLAMRAGMLLEAMAAAGPVDVVIVPVSGPGVAR